MSDKEDIIKRYVGGERLREIGKDYGFSRQRVLQIVQRNGDFIVLQVQHKESLLEKKIQKLPKRDLFCIAGCGNARMPRSKYCVNAAVCIRRRQYINHTEQRNRINKEWQEQNASKYAHTTRKAGRNFWRRAVTRKILGGYPQMHWERTLKKLFEDAAKDEAEMKVRLVVAHDALSRLKAAGSNVKSDGVKGLEKEIKFCTAQINRIWVLKNNLPKELDKATIGQGLLENGVASEDLQYDPHNKSVILAQRIANLDSFVVKDLKAEGFSDNTIYSVLSKSSDFVHGETRGTYIKVERSKTNVNNNGSISRD